MLKRNNKKARLKFMRGEGPMESTVPNMKHGGSYVMLWDCNDIKGILEKCATWSQKTWCMSQVLGLETRSLDGAETSGLKSHPSNLRHWSSLLMSSEPNTC